MAKGISQLRFEFLTKSGHDFQNLFAAVLSELLEGTVESKRLAHLDRMGVDAFIMTPDENAISTVIQCKGFELPDYGPDQHQQCREEVAKYGKKGPTANEYWLAVNRAIKDRTMRTELERDLEELAKATKLRTSSCSTSNPCLRS